MKYKYYIVYKTTHVPTKQYYIGMHCTNNLDDGYYGSGEKLKSLISEKGTEDLKRQILAHATNKRQLMALEGFYIDRQNVTDELCLNISSGLSKEKQNKVRSDNNRVLDLEYEIEDLQKKYNWKCKLIEELRNKKEYGLDDEIHRLKKELSFFRDNDYFVIMKIAIDSKDEEIKNKTKQIKELSNIIEDVNSTIPQYDEIILNKQVEIKELKYEVERLKRKSKHKPLGRNLAALLH